jgi:hypothetical protein
MQRLGKKPGSGSLTKQHAPDAIAAIDVDAAVDAV